MPHFGFSQNLSGGMPYFLSSRRIRSDQSPSVAREKAHGIPTTLAVPIPAVNLLCCHTYQGIEDKIQLRLEKYSTRYSRKGSELKRPIRGALTEVYSRS